MARRLSGPSHPRTFRRPLRPGGYTSLGAGRSPEISQSGLGRGDRRIDLGGRPAAQSGGGAGRGDLRWRPRPEAPPGQLRQGEAVELPARFPLKGRLLDRLEPEPGSLPLHTGAAGYRETVRSPSSHLKIVSRSALVRPMTKPF